MGHRLRTGLALDRARLRESYGIAHHFERLLSVPLRHVFGPYTAGA